MLVILLGEEREREGGDRKTFEIQTLLQFALAFFSLLLFTFHRRKKCVVVLRVFLLKYFSVLCLCVRVTSLRPQACVIDTTLNREINFKQKKNDMGERVEVHLRRQKSKKRRVF